MAKRHGGKDATARWGWWTEEQCDELDLGIVEAMARAGHTVPAWLGRGAVADAIGIGDGEAERRAVGRALMRCVTKGWAEQRGKTKQRQYRVTAAGRETTKGARR